MSNTSVTSAPVKEIMHETTFTPTVPSITPPDFDEDEKRPTKKQKVVEPLETWLPIPGYENYKMSSLGRVLNHSNGLLIKDRAMSAGKRSIEARKGRETKYFTMHVLVASIFSITPEKENQFFLHHIDRNRANNSVTNLKWVSVEELAAIFTGGMEEIWVPIKGYDRFFLSSMGRVMNTSGSIMHQRHTSFGASASATVSQGKKRVEFTVDRMVASLFSIKPKTKDETILHHIDFDKKNNNVNNLRWISEKDLASINMKRIGNLNMSPGEVWKRVTGYNKYYVSSFGRVINGLTICIFEQSINHEGYKSVVYRKEERKKTYSHIALLYSHSLETHRKMKLLTTLTGLGQIIEYATLGGHHRANNLLIASVLIHEPGRQ